MSYKGVVCRGSFALGSACGVCEKCKKELDAFMARKEFRDALNTPSSALKEIRELKERVADLERERDALRADLYSMTKVAVRQDAVDALENYQQADMDGTMVLVSRQAIEECLPALRALAGKDAP